MVCVVGGLGWTGSSAVLDWLGDNFVIRTTNPRQSHGGDPEETNYFTKCNERGPSADRNLQRRMTELIEYFEELTCSCVLQHVAKAQEVPNSEWQLLRHLELCSDTTLVFNNDPNVYDMLSCEVLSFVIYIGVSRRSIIDVLRNRHQARVVRPWTIPRIVCRLIAGRARLANVASRQSNILIVNCEDFVLDSQVRHSLRNQLVDRGLKLRAFASDNKPRFVAQESALNIGRYRRTRVPIGLI